MTAPLSEDQFIDLLVRGAGDDDDAIPLNTATLDTTIEDLGLDSLALMEVISLAKRERGIAVPTDVVNDVTTPRDLLDAMNASVGNLV